MSIQKFDDYTATLKYVVYITIYVLVSEPD